MCVCVLERERVNSMCESVHECVCVCVCAGMCMRAHDPACSNEYVCVCVCAVHNHI